jgi:hypothetical protein
LIKRKLFAAIVMSAALCTSLSPSLSQTAQAGSGGRFTWKIGNTYDGFTFPGAGLGEIPFTIDSNGNGKQEMAVYYRGRMTVENENRDGMWGVDFIGGGNGEVPLAIDRDPNSRKQQVAVYYNGRFTWRNDNGSYGGVTMPGASRLDIPVVADTDGNGIQEFGVYRSGRFTFLREDFSGIWGITFPGGAGAAEIPFAIDTDGSGRQRLAVYLNGRVTGMENNQTGQLWGLDFAGAGYDEMPLAGNIDGIGGQEFMMYNHVSNQLTAKQILDLQDSGRITISNYSENPSRDSADHSLATQQLADIADGGQANLSTRCTYASQLPRSINPDPTYLRFLVDFGHGTHYNMSVLFGQCHSGPSSYHHQGKAADFACGTDTGVGDQVGPRYGVRRNFETCSVNSHWHYSVNGQ